MIQQFSKNILSSILPARSEIVEAPVLNPTLIQCRHTLFSRGGCMMFSIPRTLKLEGQEFIFNDIPTPHIVTLQLTLPSMSAGDHIGWNTETFGKVVFWNAKKQTEHYYTSCHELVNLPLGSILA